LAHGRAPHRRHDSGHGKPLWPAVTHRQARAVERNTLSWHQILVPTPHPKRAAGAGVLHSFDRTHIVDQAGEHAAIQGSEIAYTVIESSPTARRSSTASRRAVPSDVPGAKANAGLEPAP